MMKLISFSLLLALSLSCSTIEETPLKETMAINKAETKQSSKIRFDFTAERTNTFRETIWIKASLFNDNDDTVYFLTSTCEGEQYSLRYDTTRFTLTPFMNCNASYPRLEKIAPKSHYDFQAHFKGRTNEIAIKLGFDFYQEHKTNNLTKLNLSDIHNRQSKAQNILWTDEKTIH